MVVSPVMVQESVANLVPQGTVAVSCNGLTWMTVGGLEFVGAGALVINTVTVEAFPALSQAWTRMGLAPTTSEMVSEQGEIACLGLFPIWMESKPLPESVAEAVTTMVPLELGTEAVSGRGLVIFKIGGVTSFATTWKGTRTVAECVGSLERMMTKVSHPTGAEARAWMVRLSERDQLVSVLPGLNLS